ncbi:unnamed protein product [Acanthocheilonema viteae]|uniref:Lipid-binding serum glycoprotein N-terminal domain-containing protein n=1 Tax=Acanthocheilonema viteae TaxID=6277 RepID=A0A498SL72_ACAVI|nr:unnamed protein product [Acanthocheilonema viteae]
MQWKKLIFFLFVGCFGLKIAYLDGDVQLQPAPSTINKTKSDIHGLPGLEFRINSKGFLYASLLAGPIINNEIRRFQLQPLKQCFQQFNGCITISNLVISRYRCPQLVSLHPSPPNRLILIIRNLDLEIRANINGEIGVILPVKLNNTVYLRIHQISVTIQFTVQHTLNGSPYVRIVRCYVSTGLSDVFLQNDDFVGNIFNTYFRVN